MKLFGILLLIIAIVEIFKRFFGINSKHAAIFAMVFGVVIAQIEIQFLPRAIITGVIVGLASSGLYSWVKSYIK